MNYTLFEMVYYKPMTNAEFFRTKIAAKDAAQAKKKFKTFYPTFELWDEPKEVN